MVLLDLDRYSGFPFKDFINMGVDVMRTQVKKKAKMKPEKTYCGDLK